jgi:hypothetical protein
MVPAMSKRHPVRNWLKRHWKAAGLLIAALLDALGHVFDGLGHLLQGIAALFH